MSVKDHTVLSPMASLELCTDLISGFMGPGKPSSPVTTSPNYTPALRMLWEGEWDRKPRLHLWAGNRFRWSRDFVNNCHTWEPSGVKCMTCWLGSSPAWCISIRITVIFSVMSDSLPLQSSRSIFGVLLMDSRSWIWLWLYYHYDYCIYLPLTLIWVNVLLVYACSSL
jgi:hypothetical protein